MGPPSPEHTSSQRSECVRVAVRARPLSSSEASAGDIAAVHVYEKEHQVLLKSHRQSTGFRDDKQFTYDRAFGPESSNDDVSRPLQCRSAFHSSRWQLRIVKHQNCFCGLCECLCEASCISEDGVASNEYARASLHLGCHLLKALGLGCVSSSSRC